MYKYHSYASFIFGVLFFVILSWAARGVVFRFLALAILGFCFALLWYNTGYLKSQGKFNPWVLIRPCLLALSGTGVYFLLPSSGIRTLFLLTSIFVIAAFEYFLSDYSENLLMNETLLVSFGTFLSLFGFNQFYPNFGLLYVILAFLASFVMVRGIYELVPKPSSVKFFSSFILALLSAELLWVLSWLPLHFSTLAIILVSIFYLMVVINYYFFFNVLNFQKIQYHIILAIFCSSVAIISTPWKIIE